MVWGNVGFGKDKLRQAAQIALSYAQLWALCWVVSVALSCIDSIWQPSRITKKEILALFRYVGLFNHHISYALIYLQWLIWDLRAKRQINYFPSLCKHEEYMKDRQYNFDPSIYLICALCKIKLPPEKWSTETETLKECHKDSVKAIQFAG